MSGADNKAVIKRVVEEAFNGGNLAVIDELVDPGYVDHDARPGTPPGPETLRRVVAGARAGFPDYKAIVEDAVAEGDKVAVRFTNEGTHLGQLPLAGPPSGKHLTWQTFAIFRFANGKIAERWGLIDVYAMLRQTGALPSPAQAKT
jgi:predicted ester cyclase